MYVDNIEKKQTEKFVFYEATFRLLIGDIHWMGMRIFGRSGGERECYGMEEL